MKAPIRTGRCVSSSRTRPAARPTDVLSRLVSERLAARLGQPVVGDNRGGAAGRLGLELLAKSPPDGYTISMPSSGMAISGRGRMPRTVRSHDMIAKHVGNGVVFKRRWFD